MLPAPAMTMREAGVNVAGGIGLLLRFTLN
jgi:hypothetical protein